MKLCPLIAYIRRSQDISDLLSNKLPVRTRQSVITMPVVLMPMRSCTFWCNCRTYFDFHFGYFELAKA